MGHHAGQAVLALLIFASLAGLLVRAAGQARRASGPGGPKARKAGGGPVSGWLAHRRALRLENAKHYNGMLREKARHVYRLREHEAREQARQSRRTGTPGEPGSGPDAPGGGSEPDSPGGVRWHATVTHVWTRWRPAGDAAWPGATLRAIGGGWLEAWSRRAAPGDPDAPGHPGSPPGPGPAASPQPQEPPAQGSSPAPGPQEPRTIEGVVMTVMPDTGASSAAAIAVPGAEQAVEGMRRIHAHAMAGNIRAKRRALLALVAVLRHASAMASALSRALSEPGQHYGPEVTEPIAIGSMYLLAAASAFSDGDDALKTLLRASLDESMRAGRQVPHHGQLTDAGAY